MSFSKFNDLAKELQEMVIFYALRMEPDGSPPAILIALGKHNVYSEARKIYHRVNATVVPSLSNGTLPRTSSGAYSDIEFGKRRLKEILKLRHLRIVTWRGPEYYVDFTGQRISLRNNLETLIIDVSREEDTSLTSVFLEGARLLRASSRPRRFVADLGAWETEMLVPAGEATYAWGETRLPTTEARNSRYIREMMRGMCDTSEAFGLIPKREKRGDRVFWVWEDENKMLQIQSSLAGGRTKWDSQAARGLILKQLETTFRDRVKLAL